MMTPTIISVSGFSSDVGKTTLMCELLSVFPGWEAIKITRGHYRSCGKDPHTCCVSHLLSDEPLVISERTRTDARGKDTGRYWAAGASNVHWLIATTEQVERGIKQALVRVRAPGVFIEGTSVLNFVDVDFALMVARASKEQIKPSARRVLEKISALYLSDETDIVQERFATPHMKSISPDLAHHLPIYTPKNLPQLAARLREIHATAAA